MQPDSIVLLESLFSPEYRHRLAPIRNALLAQEFKECAGLIKAHLREVKDKEDFNIEPLLDKFADLFLLHAKTVLHKIKVLKDSEHENKV